MKALKIICLFFLFIGFVSINLTLSGCKKETKKETVKETSTVVDRQGRVYATVKIGSQWWMSENLRVQVYNDSTPIMQIGLDSNSVWAKNNSGAFSIGDNRFGIYYNWYAINNPKKIAPAGWHVPTDEDWKILERELGMTQIESDNTGWRGKDVSKKFLPEASVGWLGGISSPVYGTNESGLAMLPGGCRVFDGDKGDVTVTAYFGCSGEKNSSTAWYRSISNTNKSVFRYFVDKHYGFNLRCVKD
jgi:uncharacterized protein (TIGR02145 family)